jgi:hypothetical protein
MMTKPFVEKPVPYSGAYSEERARELVEEERRRIEWEQAEWEKERDEKDRQLRLPLE